MFFFFFLLYIKLYTFWAAQTVLFLSNFLELVCSFIQVEMFSCYCLFAFPNLKQRWFLVSNPGVSISTSFNGCIADILSIHCFHAS